MARWLAGGVTALIRPDLHRHAELVELVAELGPDDAHGSGLWNLDARELPLRDEAGVRRYLQVLDHQADPASTYLDDTVPSDYWWITDGTPEAPDGALVGFLAFRHGLNDWLREAGGHIGYSVRPSRRREGHASAALGLAVRRRGPELGLDRALVTCDVDNAASAATILAAGGVEEDVRLGKRRFWVAAG